MESKAKDMESKIKKKKIRIVSGEISEIEKTNWEQLSQNMVH